MLLNFGHGGAMVEIVIGFPACRHNKAEVNQVFYSGHF